MILQNAHVLILTDLVSHLYWARTAGAYRIATEIRKAGYSCQVIDCFTSFTEQELYDIFDRTVGDKTLMVGLSSTFFANFESKVTYAVDKHGEAGFAGHTKNYPYSIEKMNRFFDYIKKINPKVKIVMGGYKTTWYDAPGTDTFITGLGDTAVIEYLKYLENKNPFLRYTLTKQGQMVIDGDIYNNTFDFSCSCIRYEKEDNIMQGEIAAIEVGRGCIFKCSFCSYALNGKKKNDYIKNPSVLRDEFMRNYEEYGITSYLYSDDTHNDNIEKLKSLAKVAQSLPFKLEYAGYLRVDLLHAHPEQYQLLKDGGLKGAFFGIESLNHQALKSIGKGLHPDKVVEELHKFEHLMPHVGTQGGFIVGLPHETKDTVTKWIHQVMDNKFPIDAYFIEALYLSKNPIKHYKSEFEKNSKNFYAFLNDSDDHWHNGDFDRLWALDFCSKLYLGKNQRARLGGWATIILRNLGVEQDFTKQPLVDIKISWSTRCRQLRNRYKCLLLNDLQK